MLLELNRGPLGDQAGTSAGPQLVLKLGQSGTTPGPAGDPSRARHKVLELKALSIPNGIAPAVKKRKKAVAEPAAWTAPLVEAVRSIRGVELGALTTDQKLLVGRYHALKFGHCCLVESTNVRKGAAIAAVLSAMAASEQFSDFAVYEYLAKAKEFWTISGEFPWFNPWDIRAVCGADALTRRAARR